MLTAAVLCLAVAAVLLWPGTHAPLPWPGLRAQSSSSYVGKKWELASSATRRGHLGWRTRRGRGRRGGRRRRRRQARLQGDLADFVALLAGPLRAGATPALALVTVARSMAPGPELRAMLTDLVRAGPADFGVSTVLLGHADRLDSDDLRFVASAWQLTERTGAPLADALVSVEEVLRARQRARERVASAAAGPRSSMTVLVSLPCAGPLVGFAFGISPARLYLSSPAALASAVLGLVLALLAWLWAGRIIAGALRTGSVGTRSTGGP